MKKTHCWASYQDDVNEDESFSCMLLEGHKGEHKYVNDSEIGIKF